MISLHYGQNQFGMSPVLLSFECYNLYLFSEAEQRKMVFGFSPSSFAISGHTPVHKCDVKQRLQVRSRHPYRNASSLMESFVRSGNSNKVHPAGNRGSQSEWVTRPWYVLKTPQYWLLTSCSHAEWFVPMRWLLPPVLVHRRSVNTPQQFQGAVELEAPTPLAPFPAAVSRQ